MSTFAITEEIRREVGRMLEDPTAVVSMRVGTRETTKPTDDYRTYAPTAGKTITIEIQGGAKDETLEDLAPEVLYLEQVQRLEAKPGDLIVLKVKQILSQETAARLKAQLEALFPGHRAIVLDQGTDIGLVSGVVPPAGSGA